ncbi:MAG: hypothetical protein GY820_00015, partial [Gammaproteobacteria bacterium]|nr:hypothetical protein [Gammaproteobacteria bacterium]
MDNLNFEGNITPNLASVLQIFDHMEEMYLDVLFACVDSTVEYVPINSLVPFSDRCVFDGMSQQRKPSGERGREEEKKRRLDEDKRRAEEDKQQKREDDRRREEDERRRKEDQGRQEKSRAEQFLQNFGDDLEGARRRKAARPRQSSSPPKQPIRGGQTAGGKPRAQSHQQPQSRSTSGRRGLNQLQEAISGGSHQTKDKAYQENLA